MFQKTLVSFTNLPKMQTLPPLKSQTLYVKSYLSLGHFLCLLLCIMLDKVPLI
jgi:hypothetical protein